ncbi:hypothetical protein BGX38DRAFT_1188340 [Terfezia claveryi]|nr:hypothetical protein BGX38DRAFT_1188340 [Terfezia claveryi]
MASVASPGSPLPHTKSLDARQVDAPSSTNDAERTEASSSTKDTGKKYTPCPFCARLFDNRKSYIEHLVNHHKIDWDYYSVLANARKNPPAARAPVSPVGSQAAAPIAIRLREEAPQLVPKIQKFKEIKDSKLGCVVISLDDDDEFEPQAAMITEMQTDRADGSETVRTGASEPTDRTDSIEFDHNAAQPTPEVAQQQDTLYTSSGSEPLAAASNELQGSKHCNEMGGHASGEEQQQAVKRLVNDGQEQLCSQHEAVDFSASPSELCQIDIAESQAVVTRAEEPTAVTQPPEAVVQSTATILPSSETVLESLDASPNPQAALLPHKLQEWAQAERSGTNVDILVEVQISDSMTSAVDEPLESDSRLETNDLAITLNALSTKDPQNRKTISLSAYKPKKTRQAQQTCTRVEGPPPVPQGDEQHTAQFETMGDGLHSTESQAKTNEANIEETVTSATGPAGPSLKTQSSTPSHSLGSLSAGTVDPQASTTAHENNNDNGLDLADGDRAQIKSTFAPSAKSLNDKLKGKGVPVAKPAVTEVAKLNEQALVLETAKEGNPQLKTAATYSNCQPETLPQRGETGFPELETCGADQEGGYDNAGSNANSEEVEGYPILPNPVIPQLTCEAVVSFLQSKKDDKAAEWGFWTSTAAPKVNLTLEKPPVPAVYEAHNQAKSSELRGHRISNLAPPSFKILEPKPNTPLPQQGKIVSSHAKAMSNQPTSSTSAPMSCLNKQSNTTDQPAAEVASQCNAVFLTNDGKITTLPPGAAAASSDIYMQDIDVEMKDSEGPADAQRAQESLSEPFPQPFVGRLRELEDIQYDTQKGEGCSDGVVYKTQDVDRDAPPGGTVEGQLPVALRCSECLRFHYGRCKRPSHPCILCGGQHWVRQCNRKSLRLAKTYRPGISCTKCRFMHKNRCPTEGACPICLRAHEGLCLKPSGTCRYCGGEHWENGCPRWEQLDEEMGFIYEPEEDNALKVVDMAGRVAKFWYSGAPYFDKLKDKPQEEPDIEPGECITQDDFLKVVDRMDQLGQLPKAVKRDIMSTLLEKNGSGFANAGQHDQAYRNRSRNEMKRRCRESDRDYDTEPTIGKGFNRNTVWDGHQSYRPKYEHGGRATKGRAFDKNDTRGDRFQNAYYQSYGDLPASEASTERGGSVIPPSNDPVALRRKRDELWRRGRKGVEMEEFDGNYAAFKVREAKLEQIIKEREKEERDKERNNEGRGGARGRQGGRSDFSVPPRRCGKGGESYKRAPSASSLRGKTVMNNGLEKWGDSDSYNKRRRTSRE